MANQMLNKAAWTLTPFSWITQLYSLSLFCSPPNTDISLLFIPDLFPGCFWQITTLNVAIFRCTTLPAAYWFQIKLQYFHLSISVCRCCVYHSSVHVPHTLTHSAQLYTHSSLSLVVNNVLMAILGLLTHSKPIHQTVQLAYDHNKYALDECLAVRTVDLMLYRSWCQKDKCDRKQIRWSRGIYQSNIFFLGKSVLISRAHSDKHFIYWESKPHTCVHYLFQTCPFP